MYHLRGRPGCVRSGHSVQFLSELLHEERIRRGTRKDTRALGTYKHAVLVLRWFLDDTRMRDLAPSPAHPPSSLIILIHELVAITTADIINPPEVAPGT